MPTLSLNEGTTMCAVFYGARVSKGLLTISNHRGSSWNSSGRTENQEIQFPPSCYGVSNYSMTSEPTILEFPTVCCWPFWNRFIFLKRFNVVDNKVRSATGIVSVLSVLDIVIILHITYFPNPCENVKCCDLKKDLPIMNVLAKNCTSRCFKTETWMF